MTRHENLMQEPGAWHYIGDGLYMSVREWSTIEIASHDGYTTLDKVYLEPETLANAMRMIRTHYPPEFRTMLANILTE